MFQAKDYRERLSMQKVCSYLLSGHDQSDDKTGTPAERALLHEKKLINGLLLYRDRVIAYDWKSLGDDEHERYQVSEDMWQDVSVSVCDLEFLYYEMGFSAALTILLNKDTDPKMIKSFEEE